MTLSTLSNSVSGPNLNLPGTVLSVSPDGTTVVITDPVRQTISLYQTSSSNVTTVIGGIGTRAVWSPDSQTVYITTTTNALLTHSNFTNWQTTTANEVYTDAVVMVPSIGAYFAGGSPGVNSGVTTDGRSYCAASAQSPAGRLTHQLPTSWQLPTSVNTYWGRMQFLQEHLPLRTCNFHFQLKM